MFHSRFQNRHDKRQMSKVLNGAVILNKESKEGAQRRGVGKGSLGEVGGDLT